MTDLLTARNSRVQFLTHQEPTQQKVSNAFTDGQDLCGVVVSCCQCGVATRNDSSKRVTGYIVNRVSVWYFREAHLSLEDRTKTEVRRNEKDLSNVLL